MLMHTVVKDTVYIFGISNLDKITFLVMARKLK